MIALLKNMAFPGAPDPTVQAQPAGFDISTRKIARFTGRGALDFTNERRTLPDIETVAFPESGPAMLGPGGYLVTYNEEIAVPPDCAGLILPRSSLMRCGATLHSALWDPGYRGRGQGLLTVHNSLELFPDARIGQFILIRIEKQPEELYQGTYQGENL